jgi:type IV secretory pathway VirB2 component (pilin)
MKLNFKMIDMAIIFCLMATVFYMSPAFATDSASDNAISQVLCRVVALLTGAVGKAIATIAIVVIGISLFMGKVSWPVAAATAVGIGLIFGAGQIADWLAGTDVTDKCKTE